MSRMVHLQPLTREAFAPFGDVIEAEGTPDKLINQGRCERYHDLAKLDFHDARAGISLFNSQAIKLPWTVEMVERHPEGSQAFLPMTQNEFVVVVAADEGGEPGTPVAFRTRPGQGVNYHRGVWHGVLTPLHAPGLFAVVDRIGSGPNLEEYWFDTPFIVED